MIGLQLNRSNQINFKNIGIDYLIIKRSEFETHAPSSPIKIIILKKINKNNIKLKYYNFQDINYQKES